MTDPNSSVKAGAIEQIYTQLMKVLGGNNPNQFFCMTMPGTMLNQSDFAYDTTGNKPATVTAAESRLVDQMFDIAQVTGSSNGERVSSQYLQALSALVPTFAPMMPAMKNSLREFLASPAPPDAVVEGVPYSGTIEGFYFALYEAWLDKKAEWDRLVIEQRRKLNPEDFLEWYEGVAEGYLARIDAAEGRLLAAFSPTDMDAILGALAAGPGGELQEAIDQVLDLRLPSPSGGYIYPVDLQPSNWFLDLSSDQDPANLLKDPQFIAATIGARRQAILASISQVQSMLSQMPTTGAIAAAAKTYSDAQSAYTKAQNQLLDDYTTNTVTAVELLMAAASGGESEAAVEGVEGVEELDATVESVSKASGDSPVQTSAANSDGSPLSPDDLKQLVDGQTAVIKAQSALVDGASALSAAGMNLAAQQAAYFGDLPSLLARLQSQLSDLQSLQSQMAASVQASKRQVASSSSISASAATVTAAAALANVAKTDPSSTPAAWLVALYGAIKTTDLQPVYLDAQAAWVGEVADAIATAASALSSGASAIGEAADAAAKAGGDENAVDAAAKAAAAALADPEKSTLTALIPAVGTSGSETADTISNVMQGVASVAADAAQAAAGVAAKYADPTQTTFPPAGTPPTTTTLTDPVKTAVDTVIPATGYTGVATYFDNASGDATTSANTLSAMRKVAETSAGQFKVFDSSDPSKNNRALPAGSADRWMDLQFSFSADDMTSDSSSSALSSTTDWSVDLFLGSASGKSQTSSANAAKNALDTSTTIQIGLKATKVDISRGWFDPGVFKLSKNMNRFTDQKVSWGSVDVAPAAGQPGTSIRADLKNANGAILPSYPVSFVVVKDVTIQFTASESSLDAVQSVLDSQSAVGGGFLCFSASSSSTSHSDASALHTKTVGTVVNINMPGPQILGWFIEFTPEDTSQPVTDVQVPPTGGPLDITQYVAKLMRYGSEASTPAQSVGGGVA